MYKLEKIDDDMNNDVHDKESSHADDTMMNSAKRKEKRTFKNCVVDHFYDYCSTTGLHGFSYLGQHRTLVEIIIWIILILLGMAASMYMINEIYQKFIDSPIIISIASKRTLVSKIPFPAVTICPHTKFRVHCFNYGEVRKKVLQNQTITRDEEKYYDYAEYLCKYEDQQFLKPNQSSFTEDIIDFLNQCRAASINVCTHGSRDCTNDWVPIITDEGICFTYNSVDRSEIFKEGIVQYENFQQVPNKSTWNEETATYKAFHTDNYPRSGSFSGLVDQSLKVMMLEEKVPSRDACSGGVPGYTVSFSLPARIPSMADNNLLIPKGKVLAATIKPTMIKTSESIKALDPKKRLCYFPSDKPLQYFRSYSQANCWKECQTLITKDQCHCTVFDMPRFNDTPICGPEKFRCTKEAEDELEGVDVLNMIFGGEGEFDLDIVDDTDYKDKKEELKKKLSECDCLPDCNEISYEVDTSIYEVRWEDFYDEDSIAFANSSHISQLVVTLNSRYVYTLERNELYGISDLISNFGGLIGLFTGFSILSAIEIIYFLSLRIWGNLRLHGTWAIPENSG